MADSSNRDMLKRVTQISGERLRPLQLLSEVAKEIPEKSNARLQQKRALPISDNRLSFDPSRATETIAKKAKRTGGALSDQPKYPYNEFLRLDQAGPAIIAYCENTKACSLVAVKTLKLQNASLSLLQTVRGDNVVSLLDTYRKEKDELCLVYEQMDVSLRLVNSIARGRWDVYQIAGVCFEIIQGLSFIQKELKLYHGNLDCSTVLLDRAGRAKLGTATVAEKNDPTLIMLANIGESMLTGRHWDQSYARRDVKSIGYIMMELMEEGTSILEPETVELQDPQAWQPDSIKRFLASTQTSSLAELSKHEFLPGHSLSSILKPYVFTALVCAKTEWAVLSNERNE